MLIHLKNGREVFSAESVYRRVENIDSLYFDLDKFYF